MLSCWLVKWNNWTALWRNIEFWTVFISVITQAETSRVEFKHGDDDGDDEGNVCIGGVLLWLYRFLFKIAFCFSFVGFRLFTTSIPGHTAAEPVAPVRRRPVPSSRFFFFCSPGWKVLGSWFPVRADMCLSQWQWQRDGDEVKGGGGVHQGSPALFSSAGFIRIWTDNGECCKRGEEEEEEEETNSRKFRGCWWTLRAGRARQSQTEKEKARWKHEGRSYKLTIFWCVLFVTECCCHGNLCSCF